MDIPRLRQQIPFQWKKARYQFFAQMLLIAEQELRMSIHVAFFAAEWFRTTITAAIKPGTLSQIAPLNVKLKKLLRGDLLKCLAEEDGKTKKKKGVCKFLRKLGAASHKS